MPTIRLAAAVVNQTPIDWQGNLDRVVSTIEAARKERVGLVCFPELCLTGYGCEDLYFARWVRGRAIESLIKLLPETDGLVVTVGLPFEHDHVLYNVMAVIADGRLLGLVGKQHLANDGLHYEARWFRPWPTGHAETALIADHSVPIGDLVFEFAPGVRIGIEVCRDAWERGRPALSLAQRGVSLVLNPSASHFAFGKQTIRKRLTQEGAAAINGVSLYTNLLGNESGRSIFDGGAMIARRGVDGEPRVVAAAERFSFADHKLLIADLDVPQRAGPTSERDLTPEDGPALAGALTSERVVSSDFALPTGPPNPARPPELNDTVLTKFEEFSRAAPLGLLDYLRKSGASGFVLSLSGGADSAACAVLVWLMVRLGIAELGTERFAGCLPNTRGLSEKTDPQRAVSVLLTTVYQGTANSSETTRAAAETIAKAVGAEHHEWEIDSLVQSYVDRAAAALGRPLAWETDDLALQNIQSRTRAPGVWMLANLKNALLLTTGNRSEASVGYATMDGDTAGGLAPLSGVDKAFLCEWLAWMESTGPDGIGPLPALRVINAQQPTAELRPLEERQTDEADLMPYQVLDAIERSRIVRLEDRATTLARLTSQFPDYPEEQLAAWTDRFVHLWRASQWKRERMAPGFHLDTHSVDSRGYRRWPILSGEG